MPTGGYLEQADGTAWMALFCQNMLEIGVELAAHDPAYEDLATKFAEQFLWIGRAMNGAGPDGMWDEEDGFYYDVLRLPDGRATRLKVRSMVGLLPVCAITVIEPWQRERVPRLLQIYTERLRRMPDILDTIHPTGPGHLGVGGRGIMALVNQDRLRRILSRMLDENEFLSPLRHPRAVPLSRRASLCVLCAWRRIPGELPSRPSRTPACSAATPTGVARSGCR